MANEKTPLLKAKCEVTVEIPVEKMVEYDLNKNKITTSLTYEELLPFIIDPSWIRLRKIAYTACWIAFFVILFTACIISFKSMSNTSCGKFPVTLTKIDNGMLPVYTDLGQDGAKGIISVVLSPFNVTATT